ncbi:MAG: ABC transporter permease [Methylacidiphilales bacterium]|nr:ABC transporter permease [Candidatus Methylacidiphilales bacterium]
MIKKIQHRKVLALCKKELFQIIRDPSSIVIAFLLPAILLFLFGYGINLDSQRVSIGLLVQDTGPHGQSLAQSISHNPSFETTFGNSRNHLQDLLARGTIHGIIVIPSNFSKLLASKENSNPIQVIQDGSDPNTAVFIEATIQGVWTQWMQNEIYRIHDNKQTYINILPRYWFNPSAKSSNFLIPGSIAIIMTIIGSLLSSLVIAREWERGTMESLLSSPLTLEEFLLSKFIPYYLLGIASLISCVLVTVFIMKIPMHGSFFLLFIFSTLFLVTSLSIGLFISTATKNQFNAAQISLTTAFLPAIMLSGFIFETQSMPWIIKAISLIYPATFYVNSLQNIFQAGFIFKIMLYNFIILFLYSFVWVFILFKKSRNTLE